MSCERLLDSVFASGQETMSFQCWVEEHQELIFLFYLFTRNITSSSHWLKSITRACSNMLCSYNYPHRVNFLCIWWTGHWLHIIFKENPGSSSYYFLFWHEWGDKCDTLRRLTTKYRLLSEGVEVIEMRSGAYSGVFGWFSSLSPISSPHPRFLNSVIQQLHLLYELIIFLTVVECTMLTLSFGKGSLLSGLEIAIPAQVLDNQE